MFACIETSARLVRLKVSGPLDSAGATRLRSGLEVIADGRAGHVVLDFADVTFIDGAGIGALAFLFRRLATRGRKLHLQNVAGQPRAELRRLGLDRVFGLPAAPAAAARGVAALAQAA